MAFNSHAKFRTETVSLRVSDANVRVYKINDIDGEDEEEDLPIQISPVFDAEGQVWPPTRFFSSLLVSNEDVEDILFMA